MPELPDITLYVEGLERRVDGASLESIRVHGPALLRSVDPPLAAAEGRRVAEVRRLDKRVVLGLEGELFLVLHLMIAGRLRWSDAGRTPGRARLAAARTTLQDWTERQRAETGDHFPEHVTAFRDGMAVHGRYRRPCPDCGAPVQRTVFAAHETNYRAPCQTQGRLLADRALSRLLHEDWPRTLEELEERRSARAEADA